MRISAIKIEKENDLAIVNLQIGNEYFNLEFKEALRIISELSMAMY